MDHDVRAPRVVELPEEDRTCRWRDGSGVVWRAFYSKTWWGQEGVRRDPGDKWHDLVTWRELLERGPLVEVVEVEP
jgi:hypothetical protein